MAISIGKSINQENLEQTQGRKSAFKINSLILNR